MKAIVISEYGSPDVLELKDIDKPVIKENEVLVRVNAVGLNAGDIFSMRGNPWVIRFSVGFPKPKNYVLGWDMAGRVEAVGKSVTRFQPGDEVFAACSGALAEYACVAEDTLAIKPANLTFEQAAAVPTAALTALQALRDQGKVQSGQKVLINGASGGVGTFAVQIAKALGAEVTGVCSSRNVEFVKSVGADKIIDYSKENFAQSGETYDIIFDVAGKSSFSHAKKALKVNGRYLTTVLSLGILVQMLRTSLFGSKKAIVAFTGLRPLNEQAKDLQFLKDLVEAGTIKPIIDRCYPFSQIAEAHAYADKGHKQGNVVITVANHGA